MTKSQIYPVNLLRNVARNGSKTDYFLMSDIEPEFSPDFARRVRAASEKYLSGGRKNVLVYRRFEVADGVDIPRNKSQLQGTTVNCSYTGLSVIPEFAHIPDPENFSPAQKQPTVCFVQCVVFGHTGF